MKKVSSVGRARVLREDSTDAIWGALQDATSPNDFLELSASLVRDPDNLLELPFDSSDLPDLTTGPDRAKAEIENAVLIYDALGAMPKVAAANERLWTYLALGPCRPYMEQRWPISDIRSWKNRTQDRWLMKSATYGVLIRHGISRLWWLADMTFDPGLTRPLSSESGDPWAYLKVALANEDRILAIFDRDAGLVSGIRFALLEHCYRAEGKATETWLRALMKEVTLTSGYRDLSVLDATELAVVLAELDPDALTSSST